MNVSKLSPKINDKYSPNLYKWLTDPKHPWQANSQVFERSDTDNPYYQGLWIGFIDDMGDFIGARLMGVLCNVRKQSTACWAGLKFRKAKGFWKQYELYGRCAVDTEHKEHFMSAEGRWVYSNDGKTRQCQWCKKCTQRLVSKRVSHTEHTWVNTKGTP